MTKQQDQKLQQLQAAYDDAYQVARHKPTVVNRRALKTAEKKLSEYQQQLAQNSGEPIYRNIREMVSALDADGWKLSESTAYEHRDQGKLKLDPDGTISASTAATYARNYLRKKDGTPGTVAGISPQEQKTQEEILRIRADRLQRELKYREATGELIPRNQVEIELAERAQNLKNYFDAVARSSAGRIIKLCKGDPQKAPELISFLLGQNRKAFDNYARPIEGIEGDEE